MDNSSIYSTAEIYQAFLKLIYAHILVDPKDLPPEYYEQMTAVWAARGTLMPGYTLLGGFLKDGRVHLELKDRRKQTNVWPLYIMRIEL